MTEAEFRKELKEGLHGTYIFFGDEDYLKRFYLSRAEKNVAGDDEMAEWNTYNILATGDNLHLGDLEEALLAVPMMGDRVFVSYTLNVSPTSMKDGALDTLLDTVSTVGEETVLVIVTPAADFEGMKPAKCKLSAAYKKLMEKGVPVEMFSPAPAELRKWMSRRLAADFLVIDPLAAELLTNRVGKNMYALSGELDKLCAYALANNIQTVTEAEVAFVSSKNEEDEGFALANAVLEGDRRKALSLLHGYKQRREAPHVVLASINRSFCDMLTVAALVAEGADKKAVAQKTKMHEYRAGLYVDAVRGQNIDRIIAAVKRCREADIALKTTRLDYIAVERFICTMPAGKKRSGAR